jgi:hypothetical protein
MKQRPIIMTGDSVRAIIAGRKTQTRRVMKPQPHSETTRVDWNVPADGWVPWRWHSGGSYAGGHRTGDALRCPYGQPGRWHAFRDRVPTAVGYYRVRWEPHDEPRLVYLRHCGEDPSPAEPWNEWLWAEDESGDPESICLDIPDPGGILWEAPGDLLWVRETWQGPILQATGHGELVEVIRYRATDEPATTTRGVAKWRSPIHMPKWAARLWLRVTDVRVGRVQEISKADTYAEGVVYPENAWSIANFAALWDSINAKRPGCSWRENPWCWAITFERTERPG